MHYKKIILTLLTPFVFAIAAGAEVNSRTGLSITEQIELLSQVAAQTDKDIANIESQIVGFETGRTLSEFIEIPSAIAGIFYAVMRWPNMGVLGKVFIPLFSAMTAYSGISTIYVTNKQIPDHEKSLDVVRQIQSDRREQIKSLKALRNNIEMQMMK